VSQIKIQELRSLSENALKTKRGELELELSIEKRKVASTGVASKVIKSRDIRKTIARINTLLNERGARN
jgi:ribosomal protein L29